MKTRLPIIMGALVLASAPVSAQQEQPLSPQDLEFFEAKIRPALIEHCYDCHSAESKVKGGLQVDGKVALLKGGTSGAAIIPRQPSKSLFVKAIRYTDSDMQMPPDGKLPDSVIADFEEWIRMGAPDPRVGKAAAVLKSDADREKAKEHWGFQPIVKPAVPEPKTNIRSWAKNEIDYFIQAKLEEKGMVPSIQADKLTLIRRAYFDLIGIPPSMEQVKNFMADDSPSAYEKVIDELLNSEHYGERWGRYWLDVARYADTRGEQNNNRMADNRLLHAWTYRDWVVNAVNKDMPYDKFLQYQIAADLMSGAKQEDLAALGFLSIYRAVNNKQEVIDDQIDVVTRGMMSLSVYCARCHDHKFDPVTTKDYYGLYGVFDSIKVSENKPIIEDMTEVQQRPEYQSYLNEKSRLLAELNEFRREKLTEYLGDAKMNTSRYMVFARLMDVTDQFKLASRADEDMFEERYELDADLAKSWNRFLKEKSRKPDSVFTPWRDYIALSSTNFFNESKKLAKKYYSDGKAAKGLNAYVAKAFASPARDLNDVAARYASLFAKGEEAWVNALSRNARERVIKKDEEIKEITKLEDSDMEELRQVYYGRRAPANVSYNQLARKDNNRIGNQERRWHNDIELLEMNHPGSPKRAMSVEDLPRPREPRVFAKGDPSKPGDTVPRKFIEVLEPNGGRFTRGSGRLELAYKVASAKNPLTARVAMNRVWMNHFGAPIVRTPTDFGVRAAEPTHPELLDYLSAWFIERGWSMKRVHKFIMTSATYQQASDVRPKYMVEDSANMTFWRMNRRRLDFEGFRDSLLSVSGMLDDTVGGPPYNPLEMPLIPRRTMYSYIDRRNLPDVFRTFDFANPNMTQGERFSSTVPQQALYMMNSPFVAELARNVVERADVKSKIDERQKIDALYETAFQRKPSELEVRLGMNFLKQQQEVEAARKPSQIWVYGFGPYDPAKKRLLRFTELPHYSILDGAYQAADTYPDSRLGALRVGADGGSPGPNRSLAAIRRWRSPISGTVSIDGILEHLGNEGDGMEAYIVFKEQFEVGRFIAFNGDQPTKVPKLRVAAGDTIDFVVNCRGNDNGDVFYWAPTIKATSGQSDTTGVVEAFFAGGGGNGGGMGGMGGAAAAAAVRKNTWNASQDFYVEQEDAALRMLTSWEKFAHVLLLSNEMMFFD
ncbi:MAG: DUF1553 domain-containing protein [Verrucomicrobiae bacterium]|jgi:hypothetical protein|nr:DUF1553 domain-containing protein [Verrucomicrobiae bacterium]